jgi:hypothetical protein
MQITVQEVQELISTTENGLRLIKQQERDIVALKNCIRSILHHPRSGEKLRMMREVLDRVEANLP